MTVLFLSCSVDTSLRLLEIAHAVVEGIKDHRACRRERDAQAGSRNLPHEHTASIVILETVDFIVAVLHAAANHGVADLFLFKKLLDIVQLRHETSHDDELLILCHSGIDNVGKSVQLCSAHDIDHAIVIGKVATRNLRQAQEPCENVRRGNFRLVQFSVAFVLDAVI